MDDDLIGLNDVAFFLGVWLLLTACIVGVVGGYYWFFYDG